jgi:hypothetical protein
MHLLHPLHLHSLLRPHLALLWLCAAFDTTCQDIPTLSIRRAKHALPIELHLLYHCGRTWRCSGFVEPSRRM